MSLESIRVSRLHLLDKLRENRERHIAEYEEAIAGFYVDAVKKLQSALRRAHKKDVETYLHFERPSNHKEDYDTAIEMMEMCVEPEVTITKNQFKMFVRDEWQWKEDFLRTTNLYKTSK